MFWRKEVAVSQFDGFRIGLMQAGYAEKNSDETDKDKDSKAFSHHLDLLLAKRWGNMFLDCTLLYG